MNPKFRAWDEDSQKMNGNVEIYINKDKTIEVRSKDNKTIVMQFTELKDKNGKEIFEGDIVKYKLEEKTFTDIASFNKFFACFGLEDDTGDWFCSFDWLLENIKKNDIEVVGNVYENQELLGGE
jgi:uncharacterized phage protein (TIGR01671 family)